jgi:hypothetical protein
MENKHEQKTKFFFFVFLVFIVKGHRGREI